MRSLRHFLKIFFFGFVILKLCDGRISRSIKSLKYERNGKFLFNIIQFKNDICEITAGPVNEELGVCYTSDECTSRGGMQRKSCAAGFGTCCHFRSSCFGDVSSPLAYFTNPSYPTTDNMPNYCSYNIKVTNPDVCQVRLDFLDFNLSGPDLSTAPYGRCSQDRMAVFATQQNLGLSEGNLLCGDMTGQHIYVPVNATMGQDSVRLFAMVGTAFALNGGITNTSTVPGVVLNYKWNIKIRQIDCKSNDPIVAPIGCLQYFTTPVGSIESFNFRMAGSIYPISLDYAICVKKQPGFGCINLGTVTAGDEMKMNTNGAASSDGVGPYCYHFTSLWTATVSYVSNDFIGIADGVTVNGTVKVMTSHVCGIYDPLVANFPTVSSSFAGPIVLQVKTDESLKGIAMIGPPINPQQALTFVQEGYENGFRLTYSFTNTCPTITV